MQLLRELRGGVSPPVPQKISDLIKVDIKGFVGVGALISCVRSSRLSARFFSMMVLPVIDVIWRYPVEPPVNQGLSDKFVRLFLAELANLPFMHQVIANSNYVIVSKPFRSRYIIVFVFSHSE